MQASLTLTHQRAPSLGNADISDTGVSEWLEQPMFHPFSSGNGAYR